MSLTTSWAVRPIWYAAKQRFETFSRSEKLHQFSTGRFGGRGWGYFENVQWTLSVKESICVQPLIEFATPCHDSLKWWVQLGFKPQYGMKGVCAGHVRCTALVDGARIGPQNATSCLCNTTLGIHLRVHGAHNVRYKSPSGAQNRTFHTGSNPLHLTVLAAKSADYTMIHFDSNHVHIRKHAHNRSTVITLWSPRQPLYHPYTRKFLAVINWNLCWTCEWCEGLTN